MERAFKELFDGCVDHYAHERELLPYFRAQVKIMLRMLSSESAGTVLDLGCAAGAEIPALRGLGHRLIAADLSEKMTAACKKRFANDAAVEVICAEADRIPLSANSVDYVVCLGVFEFLRDYSPALAEISRVLRPGGLVVLAIPSAISLYNVSDRLVAGTVGPLWRTVKRAMGRKPVSAPTRPETNLCVPWRFRELLRQHGLHPERDAYSNYFLYPLDRFPSIDVKVAALLEPLTSVPIAKLGAAVYLVSARKGK